MPVAIVYGEASGIIRRFVHVDEIVGADGKPDPISGFKQLEGHYSPGESIIILDAKEVEQNGKPNLYRGIEIVAEKRGKPAEDARCLVIDHDSGEIETVIQADPILDSLPAKTLYQHAEADIGWQLDVSGEFVRPATIEVAALVDDKPVPDLKPDAVTD